VANRVVVGVVVLVGFDGFARDASEGVFAIKTGRGGVQITGTEMDSIADLDFAAVTKTWLNRCVLGFT
jgi:hypothetical protein